jgi:hypothetical protein
MNIQQTLLNKYPGTEWLLVGEDYEGLEWLDESPKPTKAKLESDWSALQAELASQEQAKEASRLSALAKLKALGLTEAEIAAL